MSKIRAVARVMLFVFTAQLLAVSASAHAFADWLEHEREHAAAAAPHGDAAGDAPSDPGAPRGCQDACHASHHLQAFASFPSPIFFVGEVMQPVSQAPQPDHSASPHPLYKPPRQSS